MRTMGHAARRIEAMQQAKIIRTRTQVCWNSTSACGVSSGVAVAVTVGPTSVVVVEEVSVVELVAVSVTVAPELMLVDVSVTESVVVIMLVKVLVIVGPELILIRDSMFVCVRTTLMKTVVRSVEKTVSVTVTVLSFLACSVAHSAIVTGAIEVMGGDLATAEVLAMKFPARRRNIQFILKFEIWLSNCI
jgi:hypothetical protein